MVSHELEHGVLVITLGRDPAVDGRAALGKELGDLIRAYEPAPVVIDVDQSAVGAAAVGVILRVQRLCTSIGVLMSVTTHSAPMRRMLEAQAVISGVHLVVNARADTAIAAAAFADAA